jgi:hypothetical protein
MKRIIPVSILFLILTFSMYLNAQFLWVYGGNEFDSTESIQQTADGGYIVAGYTTSFGAGDVDIWVLKLFSNGDVEWQKTYGGNSEDGRFSISIQQTADGGYIVASFTTSFGAGDADFWILKLSSTGDVEWQKTYGGNSEDGAYSISIQQTADGGYIVAGHTEPFGAGSEDIWILKLSSTGDVEWQKTYGGNASEWVSSIQQTADGGYIVASFTSSFGAGSTDFWILKLSSAGDVEWQKTYGGNDSESARSIQQTADGGYIVAGITWSFGAGNEEVWILKLSSTGDVEWQKTNGGNGWDVAFSIRQIADGGYIVAGYTTSFGAGDVDIWVLKLFSNGDVEWQKTYGGNGPESARSIQQTADGGYIVASRTNSFGSGSSDFLILKLDANGDIPSCAIVGSSDATVSDTSVSPSDTSVTPMDTDITPLTTDILPQESDAIGYNLCPGQHTLTLSATSGGTTTPAPGSHLYDFGTRASVTATANTGYQFSKWGGDASGSANPITITMDTDISISAIFTTISTDKKDGCFIATAAYGSSLHPYLDILRDFRDKYLMPSRVGRALVDLYYKYSLYVADFIRKHKVLKIAARINLLPVIAFSYSMLHFGPTITAFMLAFVFALPIFFIWFYRRRLRILAPKFEKAEK